MGAWRGRLEEPPSCSIGRRFALLRNDRSGAEPGVASATFGAHDAGTFVGNAVMGLLYGVGATAAYGYAALVAAVAGVIELAAVPSLRLWQAQLEGGGP
jgi:hypothetical protein